MNSNVQWKQAERWSQLPDGLMDHAVLSMKADGRRIVANSVGDFDLLSGLASCLDKSRRSGMQNRRPRLDEMEETEDEDENLSEYHIVSTRSSNRQLCLLESTSSPARDASANYGDDEASVLNRIRLEFLTIQKEMKIISDKSEQKDRELGGYKRQIAQQNLTIAALESKLKSQEFAKGSSADNTCDTWKMEFQKEQACSARLYSQYRTIKTELNRIRELYEEFIDVFHATNHRRGNSEHEIRHDLVASQASDVLTRDILSRFELG